MKPAAVAAALLPALLGACGGDEVAGPEARLEIVPDSVTLTHVGHRFAFSVRGGAAAGAVRWSSGDTAVFVVDANGAVTARRNGVAHVMAWSPESSDLALLQVRQIAAALEAFGDGQRGTAALPLLEPVGVRVLDAGGAPVARAPVRFEPGAGSGRADPGVATTDSLGLASTVWTLGPGPGRQTLGAASAEGGAGVEIAATALKPDEAVASFEVISGEDQWAWAGRVLPEPVAVRAADEGGRPVWGAAVRFEPEAGSGRADPQVIITDSLGLASAAWTLGTTPGLQTLVVSTGGGASVEIAAAARDPDEAVASFEVHSGEDQWALGGRALPEPVAVRVADEAGQPVWGATVRFEPEAGSGRADPREAATDSLGLASAAWTLGERLGAQRLVATAAGELTAAFEAAAVSNEGVCNRTPAVSQVIVGMLSGFHRVPVAGCAEVTGEMLGRITFLGLSGRGIRRLRSGDFDGLVALEDLYLYGNDLTEPPPDVFGGLGRLRKLQLYDNQLTRLPPDIFKDLPNLELLFLHGNQLTELPPGILGNQSRLERLDLSDNQLSELRPDIFKGLSRLRRLDLDGNELAELPPGIFKGLSDLKELYLWRNGLRELAPGTFAGLDALETLRFGNNELTELPEDLFDGLSNLVLLTMRQNKLSSLPPGIFDGLSSLGYLVVGDNRLTELPPGLFARTPRLWRISLDGNQLTGLPPGLFSGTPALERLHLHDNRLRALPEGIFDGLPELVRLHLRGNRLEALPEGIFAGTPKLAEVNLDHNVLAELPRGVFAGLSELKWVTLDGNPGAPFPVRPEFARLDAEDPLAPGPARVAVRVPMGAPSALAFPVSVQRGTSSRDAVPLLPGDTLSAPFVVTRASGGEGAVHVGFGPPPHVTAAGYEGSLEPVRGGELVLFAASDNGSPVARSPIRAHRMQAGGPGAEVVLGDHFGDPDGDPLAYEAAVTVEGVVEVRVEDGVLRLEPGSVDTTEVEVTATDPGGLRTTQRFRTWVVPAPDPDAFNIELYFDPGFTAEEEEAIRRAADRWMEAVTGDLPDVPVHRQLEEYCFAHPSNPRVVGVIDDVLIRMSVASHLGGDVAWARTCGRREESGLAFLGGSRFAQGWTRLRGLDYLYETALHEIGHVLGIGDWRFGGPETWRDLFRVRDGDAHFAGPQAVAAFNAAGGEGYTGGKVPLEDRRPTLYIHWRGRVIPDDIMAPGGGSLLTAITLGALADLGYEVDMDKADPYTLPMSAWGDVGGGAAAADEAGAEVLVDDVIVGPVVVVDRDGKVVRVIRR